MNLSPTAVILHEVTEHYTASSDFNGMPVNHLAEKCGSWPGLQDVVAELLRIGKLTLAFASVHENPHIKRFRDLPIEQQLELLQSEDPSGICAYPSATVLSSVVDVTRYEGKPFTLRLALGEAQLQPTFFDLTVLEGYYADPRYLFSFDGYDGSISISSKFYEASDTPERDKVVLQTFGLGYDMSGNRVIAAFLRYLSALSPEHQQIWNAHRLDTTCKLAEPYWRNTIGQWWDGGSYYDACVEELKAMNEMAQLIGRTPIFRNSFSHSRPKEFNIFLRPTRKNYLEFAHVLDKMLSENIDMDFFNGDVPLEETIQREDGRIETRRRGSLTVLAEWLNSSFRCDDPAVVGEIIGPLREVRKLRQRPAHATEADDYDRKYHTLQNDLIRRVYGSLRLLRMAFSLHPKAREYEIADWVKDGKVFLY